MKKKHILNYFEQNSTIDTAHQITLIFESTFLDLFRLVTVSGTNLNKTLPKQYSKLLTSYIMDRLSRIKPALYYSDLKGNYLQAVTRDLTYIFYVNYRK